MLSNGMIAIYIDNLHLIVNKEVGWDEKRNKYYLESPKIHRWLYTIRLTNGKMRINRRITVYRSMNITKYKKSWISNGLEILVDAYSETLSIILGHCGSLWVIVGHCEICSANSSDLYNQLSFSGSLWVMSCFTNTHRILNLTQLK